jgi:hypothetical protein
MTKEAKAPRGAQTKPMAMKAVPNALKNLDIGQQTERDRQPTKSRGLLPYDRARPDAALLMALKRHLPTISLV